MSAFQAEHVGSIPITRSKKRLGIEERETDRLHSGKLERMGMEPISISRRQDEVRAFDSHHPLQKKRLRDTRRMDFLMRQ